MILPDAYLFNCEDGYVLQLASDRAREKIWWNIGGRWYLAESELDDAFDLCDNRGLLVRLMGQAVAPTEREPVD